MGHAIAINLLGWIDKIIYIHGSVCGEYSNVKGAKNIAVETTEEMKDSVLEELNDDTLVIMAAAPADFKPAKVANEKINIPNTDDEKLGSVYSFGIAYEASDKFFVTTKIIKDEGQPVNVDAAFEYNFMKQFFVRGGISSEVASSFMGAGVGFKSFRLDVSASYHQQLGFTPGLLLIVNFNEQKD